MDRRVYLLTACIGLIGANSLSLAPIAPVVAAGFNNAPLHQVLWAVGGFGLGTAVSALVLAPFVDRIGAATALRLTMGALVLCFTGSAIAPTLWLLIVLQSLAGVAAGIGLPSTYALGAEIAKKGDEARTMGMILTGWTIAMMFGVTGATLIADYANWRLLFIGFAGLAALLLLLTTRMQVPAWVPRAATHPLKALRLPGLPRSAAVAIAFMLAFYSAYPFLAPHVIGGLGLPPSATAVPVLAYGIGFASSTVLDPYLDRMSYKTSGRFVFGLAVLILISLSLWNRHFSWVIVAMGLYGLVNHAGLTLILNRLIAVDPSRKGAILGIYAFTTYICVTIGAVAFAPVFAWGGYTAVTAGSALCAAVMFAELWVGPKNGGTSATSLPGH